MRRLAGAIQGGTAEDPEPAICRGDGPARAGIDPDRVKFKRTVRVLRRRVADLAFPPEQTRAILAQVKTDITAKKNLNPRRRHRTCPRVIKRGRHNAYRVKKPGDKNVRDDSPATIRLANPVLTGTAA